MEKQRMQQSKNRAKSRGLPPSGDFIALGSKSRASTSEQDAKTLQPLARKPTQTSTSVVSSSQAPIGLKEKRKDLPAAISLHTPSFQKQGKLPSGLFSPTPSKSRSSPQGHRILDNDSPGPPVVLLEASAADLESIVLESFAMGQQEQAEGYLCGALKSLKVNRLKPDPMLYLTIVGLAKAKPELFVLRGVTEHLLMFLKRETSPSAVKSKPNPLLTSMACNVLASAFQNEVTWPQSFIKIFVEDALGDRSWVDSEHCKGFVDNILASFGTVLPSKPSNIDQPKKETHTPSIGSQVSHLPKGSDEEKILEEAGITVTADKPVAVMSRYASPTLEQAVQYYIQDIVKEQLTKRQMIDGVSRNMLRFLTSVCGYPEVRLIASQKIEAWLQNPKLTRPSQELLMAVAMNCNTHTRDDIEVIGNLIKMRLKTKPLANHYISCVKELINQHPDNLGTTLKHVIFNELSPQRNPNNMAILQVIFQIEPENAAKYLALVFQDLLANWDDYLKSLKSLFREIVRVLRFEINFVAFCRGLMQERNDTVFAEFEQNIKDRIFSSLVSLICMSMLVSVSPAVKDIAVAMGRGEKRDLSVLQEFQTQISLIQRDAVWWFHTKVLSMFSPSEKEFISCLNKILFLESNECYQSKDSWPSENETSFLLPIVKDVPLTEDTLLRLLLLGLSDDFPMNCADTIDVVERVVLRSAVLRTGLQGLEIERQTVMEMVLSLCVYSHPKEISLPQGYQPPQLAISNLYWKGWTVLLILAACNPLTIGLAVWQSYPTARCMVEMIITRNYTFPPLATTDSTIDEIKATELQLHRAEKDEILVFESHLAAATSGKVITEENSLLIDQLISLDPSGPPRRPPQATIDHLKVLNKSLGLDYMFCKSRNPDFLLDIIHSQGSTRSMPWLADLVQSSEGSLNVLPSQCLCEFLLMKDEKVKHHRKSHHSQDKKLVHARVVERLQSLLKGEEATNMSTREIMEYFFSRLQSNNMKEREHAVKALKIILECPSTSKPTTPMETDDVKNRFDDDEFHEYSWLLKQVPDLKYFTVFLPALVLTIRQAMYGEMDVTRLQAYILFVSRHVNDVTKEELNELTEDVSQLVTTRGTLLNGLVDNDSPHGPQTYEALLRLYASALEKSVESNEFSLQWSSDQEKVHVSWSADTIHPNMSASLHVRVIHASIVLLACNPLKEANKDYNLLLSTWFPEAGNYEVRLADTGEEAILLQDWLRMKMVTSGLPRLVDTALQGLVPAQLVLFIQTFGLPVASVSKLLSRLDDAAVSSPADLSQAIVDRDYLYQLVEVQWARGATGGEQLSDFLGQEGPSKQEASDLDLLEETMTPFVAHASSPEYMKEDIKRPIIFNKDVIEQLFLKMYFDETIKKETTEAFAELKKVLAVGAVSGAKDKTVLISLIDALQEILLSDIKENFIEALYKNTEKTCAIFNLLSKNDLDDHQKSKVMEVIETLRSKRHLGNKVDSFLTLLAENFGLKEVNDPSYSVGTELKNALMAFINKDNSKLTTQSLSLRITHILTNGIRNGSLAVIDLDMNLLVKACHIMQEKNLPVLKKFIDAACNCFIDSNSGNTTNTFDNIKTCVQFLVDLYKHGASLGGSFSCGLILDWLEILDPEIVHVDPLLQREMLFMDRKELSAESEFDRSKTSASYLRALLGHQSKDTTLLDCLDWLLTTDVISSRLNPTAALDLIGSVVCNPKLWQGRDSKMNSLDEDKGHRINDEVTLDLSVPQICKLVELILAEMEIPFSPVKDQTEATSSRKPDSEKSKSTNLISADIVNIAEKRIPLLLNHVNQLSSKKMERLSNTIKKQKRFPKAIVSCLLHQIYLQRPNLLSISMQEMFVKESADKILEGEKSSVDDFVHNLMISAANTRPISLWEDEFHNLIIICRRLAFKHPLLIVRHLSALMSVIQGRHRMGSTEFANANQLMLFTQVLSLLDLLRPYIFVKNSVAKDGLKLSINIFIDLIQSYCLQGVEAASIVTKFIEFLNNFVAHDSSYAFSVLSPDSSFFVDLSFDHSGFVGLKFLCTFLSLGDNIDEPNSRILSTPVIPSLSTPWTDRQLIPFRQQFVDLQNAEVVSRVLADLDETSKRRGDILPHFLDELILLLTSSYSKIREQAHILLLRHYRHQPSGTVLLIKAYLNALESESQDVVLSAAKFIPQLVLLADDGNLPLLQKLFSISTSSRPEAREFVSKSIRNLNLDI